LPHLLFYGPPGSGKTSVIRALVIQLFGAHNLHHCVLELNASLERGIKTIREKVKAFAGLKPLIATGIPAFKVIILDEADSMTKEAQGALRRIMELYVGVTRFCIIGNYVAQISDAIISRCVRFRFLPLSQTAVVKRLNEISLQEKLDIEIQALRMVAQVCQGDLRKGINLMQITALMKEEKSPISERDILDNAHIVPHTFITTLLGAIQLGDVKQMEMVAQDVIDQAYLPFQLLEQLQQAILESKQFTETQKADLCEHLGSTDETLNDGGDVFLQILEWMMFSANAILPS
jgi:replication factor C subunit 2/4